MYWLDLKQICPRWKVKGHWTLVKKWKFPAITLNRNVQWKWDLVGVCDWIHMSLPLCISSVESQKGDITILRCSVKNQKAIFCLHLAQSLSLPIWDITELLQIEHRSILGRRALAAWLFRSRFCTDDKSAKTHLWFCGRGGGGGGVVHAQINFRIR